VDKEGKTIDFLLTSKRDKAVALRFFEKTLKASGVPEKIRMDKSGANKAAMDEINTGRKPDRGSAGEVPQQHREAEQSGHQADAQLQVILGCQKCPGRHRTHAYDPQRSARAESGIELSFAD
jgi:transposase-like protein